MTPLEAQPSPPSPRSPSATTGSTRAPDRLLILAVFVVASCGLAYELVAGALTSYLLGDSILQFSTIIGCYLFAMGVGSHLSKYVKDDDVLARFVDIELLVGLLGGLSATVLFVVLRVAVGAVPHRAVRARAVDRHPRRHGDPARDARAATTRRASFSDIVSRVLTFDYLGALAVSLLFPLLLAPRLGLARTALLFGIANVGVALWTIHRFRDRLAAVQRPHPARVAGRWSCCSPASCFAERLTDWSRARPVRRRDRPRDHDAVPAARRDALEGRPAALHQRQPAVLARATSIATTRRSCIR